MWKHIDYFLSTETIVGQEVNDNAIPKQKKWFPFSVFTALACWMAIWFAAVARYSPPVPVTSDSTMDFSAARAEKILEDLIADGIPHPAGSKQNDLVCQKIIDRFEDLGYPTKVHAGEKDIRFRRNEDDSGSVNLKNILATLPGDPDRKAVVVAAHHDSVPYGPGAADDGVAVAAILEIAQLAKQQLGTGRTIIFLITDGEEYGLLGAKLVVESQQLELVEEVEFVVNLEARGTSGPSLMFQTSDDIKQMIQLFAANVKRPVTSSIFEEVYRRLPNDTDFTIFRDDANWRGFNFAFIGDARNYHTPNDNFENFDRGSLQHHGDNAWQLLKALHQQPATARTTEAAVYFDFYSLFVVWWPSIYTLPICGIALVLFLIAARLPGFDRLQSSSHWWKQWLILVSSIGAAFVSVAGLDYCFRLEDRLQSTWVDVPEPITLSFWTLAIGMVAFVFSISTKHDESKCWILVWSVWGVFAIGCALYVPGASYLFLLPLAVAAMIRILFKVFSFSSGISNCLTSIFTVLLWIPVGILFYDAIGFSMLPVTLLRIAFVVSTLLPLFAKNERQLNLRYAIILVLAAIVSVVISITLNPSP